MLNREMFILAQAFGSVGDLPGATFSYAVLKNRAKVQSALAVLHKVTNHPQKGEFEEKRKALWEEHCAKDEDGKPILEEQNYTGLEGNEAYEKAFEALREEYKEVIEQNQKNNMEFQVNLNNEADIELHMISMEDVPENISPKQLEGIAPMIRDFTLED